MSTPCYEELPTEHIIKVAITWGIPIAEVLVERKSLKKHLSHLNHFFYIPTPNVLVERITVIKHIFHISHLRCSPISNVLVEHKSY